MLDIISDKRFFKTDKEYLFHFSMSSILNVFVSYLYSSLVQVFNIYILDIYRLKIYESYKKYYLLWWKKRMIFIKEKILYNPLFLPLHKNFPIIVKCHYF